VSGFERFEPQRRGRVPESGTWVRLSQAGRTWTLRITRGSLDLIGIETKRGDHPYFVVEVDRETGALRLTPTDNVGIGRLMNPTNRQINLGQKFVDWTGWGESRWALRAEDGVLIGDVREPISMGGAS
jgi:hypothetical protein